MCIVISCLVFIVVVVLCVLSSSYAYLLYYVCIVGFTLDGGMLARSQYSESPATGHLDISIAIIIIIIIIIITTTIIIITFVQGNYTYIPETNCVPREYSVAAILLLLYMVLI